MSRNKKLRRVTDEEFSRMSPLCFDPLAIYENPLIARDIAVSGLRKDYLKDLKEKADKETSLEIKKKLEEEIVEFEEALKEIVEHEKSLGVEDVFKE